MIWGKEREEDYVITQELGNTAILRSERLRPAAAVGARIMGTASSQCSDGLPKAFPRKLRLE
jgi:hypothetical protein